MIGGERVAGTLALTVLAAAVTTACETPARSWTPVLASTPPAFLERELDEALEEVRRARSDVQTAPEMAESVLASAEGRLEHLAEVYLPVYRAKIEVANAYREALLGETGVALQNVEAAEDAVAAVNRATAGSLEPELRQVVEPLADARLALEGGSPPDAHLERAAETLEDLLTRAGLLR